MTPSLRVVPVAVGAILAPAVAACALLVPAVAAARPTLDAARLDQLGRYEVLTFADPIGDGLERSKAIGVFDATPDEVFRIATEYQHYPEFMPRVTAMHVVGDLPGGAQVEFDAKLTWPIGSAHVVADYHYEKLKGDIYRVRFTQSAAGSLRQYDGSLYIEPWADGKTAVTYELVAEPRSILPRSSINKGVRRSARAFVNALRQHINDLHAAGRLHPNAPPGEPGSSAPTEAPLEPAATSPPATEAKR